MILLNTTFCISPADTDNFRRWIDKVYLPEVKSIEDSDHKFLKVGSTADDCLSFAVQFTLGDESDAQIWIDKILNRLVAKAYTGEYNLSPDRLLHFSTIMEILD